MLNVKLARGVSDLATTASGAVIGGCGPDVSHLPVFGVIADAKADGVMAAAAAAAGKPVDFFK